VTSDTTPETASGPAALTFRAADDGDTDALVELINSAYRGEDSRRGWTTEADLLGGQRTDSEMLKALLAEPDTRLLLAEEGAELLACCELRRAKDAAYFGTFSVRPTAQGRGLGGLVLAEAERIAARDWGCTRMRMTVLRQREELIAWYERRGYHRTGRRSPFPYGDDRFGLPRRGDLEFEELDKSLQG
jgi:ribosomal protein S18 acetylase RimI-like enzyme